MKIDLTKDVIYRGGRIEFHDFVKKIEKKSREWMDFLSSEGRWQLLDDLKKKFSPDGGILPFFGDTVVIPVDERYKRKVIEIQDVLYQELEDLMAERLVERFLHITVHDLDNELGKWENQDELRKKVEKNREKCEKIFMNLSMYLKENPDHSKLKMKGIGILGGFVAVSIAFVPVREEDFKILLNLYDLFEDIVAMSRDFYPHLTLGYYRARDFLKDEIGRMRNCILKLNDLAREVSLELDLWELSYQIFRNMNDYETVFKVRDFA